jgi:general secretion pathway protein D
VSPGTRPGVGTGIRTPTRSGVGMQQPFSPGVGAGRGMIYPQQAAQPVSPGAAQADFTGRLRQILQRASAGPEVQLLEDARIVPDERSNTLVIFAHKRDMEMIKQIVAKMDVLLAQVLIEAIILEVQIGDGQTLGVSMVQHPRQFGSDFTGAGVINNNQPFLSGLTNFPAGSPSGLTYFGRIGNDFDMVINAIARDNNFRVISRPRIQTSHAIPGNFFIGETVPYVTGAFDYGFGGVGAVTRSQVQQIRVGLNLDVVPFITPEGYVVMEIIQDVNALSRDVIIDGNPIPVITERTASATLTVRDGDTIMMGGFISENKSQSKSGVPVLKDIPGLGALFRTKTSSTDRTELIILMRATVLPSPDAAAYHAQVEKGLLPGVQQAERDFERSEAHRFRELQRR